MMQTCLFFWLVLALFIPKADTSEDADDCDCRKNGIDPCAPNGHCICDKDDVKCACSPEYVSGQANCNTPSCVCDLFNPCQNGGTCTCASQGGSHTLECKCKDGYKGEFCQFPACHCDKDPNFCVGRYSECFCECGSSEPKCKCHGEYWGVQCRDQVCGCDMLNTCLNGGLCRCDSNFNVYCKCQDHFYGKRCEIDVSGPSSNHKIVDIFKESQGYRIGDSRESTYSSSKKGYGFRIGDS